MIPAAEAVTLPEGEAHVWCAWTAPCDTPALRAYYVSLLSAREKERLERFAFDHLRLEYLVTRALCRTVLSAYAAVPPECWRFRTNSYGRPEIDAGEALPPLRFNLSNARHLVACVMTRTADAGIDVEDTGRRGETVSIAEHYFSPQELLALHALPAERRRRRFFELWTLKESYIKAEGMGLSIPLDRFSFLLPGPPIRIAFEPGSADTAGEWQFGLFHPDERHLVALSIRRARRMPFRLRFRETVPGPELTWRDVPCASASPTLPSLAPRLDGV